MITYEVTDMKTHKVLEFEDFKHAESEYKRLCRQNPETGDDMLLNRRYLLSSYIR